MIVNVKDMLEKAKNEKYAVAQINVNNLEWAKSILEVVKETNSPVILGFTEGAVKYQGGWNVVVQMTKGLLKDLDIQQDVAIHLDHGSSFEACKNALEAGFTSVMYDGSSHEIGINVSETKKVVELAKKYNATVEAEVGTLGGEEDGVNGQSMYASLNDVMEISQTGIDLLATAVGNAHGVYKGEVHLSMDLIEEFSNKTKLPLVLHGGSGIPNDLIKESIQKGMAKINVNTELQLSFAKAIREYIEAKKDLDIDNTGYDPRKILAEPIQAMKRTVKEKFEIFGSINKG